MLIGGLLKREYAQYKHFVHVKRSGMWCNDTLACQVLKSHLFLQAWNALMLQGSVFSEKWDLKSDNLCWFISSTPAKNWAFKAEELAVMGGVEPHAALVVLNFWNFRQPATSKFYFLIFLFGWRNIPSQTVAPQQNTACRDGSQVWDDSGGLKPCCPRECVF